MSDNKIFLEVNGRRFEGFTTAQVDKSIESFAGGFSFSVSVKEFSQNEVTNRILQLLKGIDSFKVQDEVRIFIDNNLAMTGFITDINVNYTASSHEIVINGNDKTIDLIDSSIVQKSYDIRDFERLINVVLKDNNYNDIEVENDTSQQLLISDDLIQPSNKLIFDKQGSIKTESNDSIFTFLDRYAQKLQVLLTTNKDGNILITREGNNKLDGVLINEQNNNNNNIISANINVSSKDRFRTIEVCSQSKNTDFSFLGVVQKAEMQDLKIRSPRRKRITYSVASDVKTVENLARWQINLRKAKGSRYRVNVYGFYAKKDLFRQNSIVSIKDDKSKVEGEFLIAGVSYNKSLNSGTISTLEIVNLGAFSLGSTEDSLGSEFFRNN